MKRPLGDAAHTRMSAEHRTAQDGKQKHPLVSPAALVARIRHICHVSHEHGIVCLVHRVFSPLFGKFG